MSIAAAERDDPAGIEEPWPVPEGWAWAQLELLASVISRGRAPEYVPIEGITVLNQKCIRWGEINFQFSKRTSSDAFDKYPSRLVLQDRDILWNSTGYGTIGRAAVFYAENAPGPVVIDTHITIVRCAHCVPEYLSRFISTFHAQKIIADLNVGSTNQVELPRSVIAELLIPLPPVPEQRRIVARIDQLFAEIEEGEAALERARTGLQTWRRALLKAAATGELTREWRDVQEPVEMTADVFNQLQGSRGLGSSFSAGSLPGLPNGWSWIRFGDLVASLRNGTSAVPAKERTPNRILRISAVRPLAVDTSDHRHLSDTDALAAQESKVDRGDLLFTRYNGSRHLVGVCGMFRGDAPIFYPDKIIRARLHSVVAELSIFIEAAMNTWVTRKFIDREIKTTAGQHGISGASLKNVPVPLPPLQEGITIGTLLQNQLTKMETVAEEIRLSAELLAIRQSVLKSAFEGRLVPQDQNDDTASSLLALARANAAPAPRRARGRKPTP